MKAFPNPYELYRTFPEYYDGRRTGNNDNLKETDLLQLDLPPIFYGLSSFVDCEYTGRTRGSLTYTVPPLTPPPPQVSARPVPGKIHGDGRKFLDLFLKLFWVKNIITIIK